MNAPRKNQTHEIESRLLGLPASSIVLIPARLVGHGVEGSPGALSNSYFTFEPIPYFEFLPDADGDEHRINIYADHKHLMETYDLNEWVKFYNYLIDRKDTNWTEHELYKHTPLEYVGEQN